MVAARTALNKSSFKYRPALVLISSRVDLELLPSFLPRSKRLDIRGRSRLSWTVQAIACHAEIADGRLAQQHAFCKQCCDKKMMLIPHEAPLIQPQH